MRRTLLIISLLIIGDISFAQTVIKFNKDYPMRDTVTNYAASVCDVKGGYVLYGTKRDTISPYYCRLYLMKVDSLGNANWIKSYGKHGYDYNKLIIPWGGSGAKVPWGGFIGTGYISDSANKTYRKILFRFDGSGDTVWSKTYLDTDNIEGWYVKVARKNRYIIGANWANYETPNYRYTPVLIETDSSGNVIWQHTYHSPPGYCSEITGIDTCTDGGFVIAVDPYDTLTNCGHYLYIIKTDSAGNVKWTKNVPTGSPCNSLTGGIISLQKGGYLVSALRDSTAPSPWPFTSPALYLVKLDNSGNVKWQKHYGKAFGQAGDQFLIMPKELSNGDFLACGNAVENNQGVGVIVKTDSNGNQIWLRYVAMDTPSCVDYLFDIVSTSDNGFASCGATYGYVFSWLVKGDSNGCTDSAGCNFLGVDEQKTHKADMGLYPNPNNGRFTIELPEIKSKERIEIFNMLGAKIYTNALISSSLEINLGNKPNGIYLYRVLTETGEPLYSGKFIIQ